MFLKGLLQANGSDYKQLRLYTTGDLNYSPQLLHYLWYVVFQDFLQKDQI